jgi:hypothetical protein
LVGREDGDRENGREATAERKTRFSREGDGRKGIAKGEKC